MWFANKRIMKATNIVTTFFWKNLECELCKTPYPYETRSLDGKKMLNIIEYDTPEAEEGFKLDCIKKILYSAPLWPTSNKE